MDNMGRGLIVHWRVKDDWTGGHSIVRRGYVTEMHLEVLNTCEQ